MLLETREKFLPHLRRQLRRGSEESRRLASALLHQIYHPCRPDLPSNRRLPNFRRAEGRDSRATFGAIDNYPHDALTRLNDERNVGAAANRIDARLDTRLLR